MSRGKRKPSRFSGCRGKARFGSPEEAMGAANAGQLPYPCPGCGCFHLATMHGKPRRKAVAVRS